MSAQKTNPELPRTICQHCFLSTRADMPKCLYCGTPLHSPKRAATSGRKARGGPALHGGASLHGGTAMHGGAAMHGEPQSHGDMSHRARATLSRWR